ncbi:GNAT family N-acetyltransferase [Actinokineospora iranica]|uniref:GNAT family N-acetyltransferase n=1 Tax=Actinokineospora iranica TaxID=1271860 RepID=UPI0015872B50|nr:GNAT family N-acetyltransferase [Actinokineospora iranica]
MSAPVLVREATAEDAAAIGEVHAEAWRLAYGDLFENRWLPRFVEERRTKWTAQFADLGADSVLVAQRGDGIVAFARFGTHPDNPSDGELRAFYTHPSCWGTGVSETLMHGVWDNCEDIRRMRLWTLAGSTRARRFYLRIGYTETGLIRERDYGDGRPVLEIEFARRPGIT